MSTLTASRQIDDYMQEPQCRFRMLRFTLCVNFFSTACISGGGFKPPSLSRVHAVRESGSEMSPRGELKSPNWMNCQVSRRAKLQARLLLVST